MINNPKLSYLKADLRSLSLFRIILGISILYNLYIKSFYCIEFWGAEPIIPIPLFQTLNGVNSISIFDYIRNDNFAYLYFAASYFFTLLFTLGIKTRITTVICCFLFWNLLQSSATFTFGFDYYTFHLLFLACFLPLDSHFLVKIFKEQKAINEPRLIFSILIFYQIAWIYLASAFAKYGESWMNGYAVQNMLLDKWATTGLGKLLSDQYWYYMPATYLTLTLEFSLVFLIFLPYKSSLLRFIASTILFVFHLNIALTYDVGNFSISGFAAAALLLPAAFWDRLKVHKTAFQKTDLVKNVYLRRIGLYFSIFVLFVITVKNLNFCSNNNFFKDSAIAKSMNSVLAFANIPSPIRVSFFNQHWKMFAPNPPVKSGWLALEVQKKDGLTYDFFNNQLITEEPKINWTPKGLEFYLLYYCRNFDNPNGNNVKYKLFLKYWIKYILKKHKYPMAEIDNLIFSDYIYTTAKKPHKKKVNFSLYSAVEIINQEFEKPLANKSSSFD